jgi:hypothetical protein
MKTLIIAAVAAATGTILGYLLCAAVNHRLRRRMHNLQRQIRAMRGAQTGDKPGEMGVMDKVLIFEAVVLIIYTAADLIVFWHTGAEPYTLTGCVFGVCGLENGVMGWIKTTKDRTADAARTGGSGPQAAQETPPEEPPAYQEEPPDAGL